MWPPAGRHVGRPLLVREDHLAGSDFKKIAILQGFRLHLFTIDEGAIFTDEVEDAGSVLIMKDHGVKPADGGIVQHEVREPLEIADIVGTGFRRNLLLLGRFIRDVIHDELFGEVIQGHRKIHAEDLSFIDVVQASPDSLAGADGQFHDLALVFSLAEFEDG